MHTLGTCRWIGVALILVCIPSARADIVFLKDGYVIQGKIRRETVVEFDSVSKEMVSIPRGFFMVDDGPRRVYLSLRHVSIVEKLAPPADEGVNVGRFVTLIAPQPMPPIEGVLNFTEWNPKTWEREFYFRSTPPRVRVGVKQMIARINPYYAQASAITRFGWHSGYMMKELDPENVYQMLKANKAFAESDKLKPQQIVARRMRLINFLTQAGWYDLSDKELDRLVVDMPEQKSRVLESRAIVDKQRAKDRWEVIKTWYAAGRYDATRKGLADFPLRNAPDKVLADLREMRTRVTSQDEALKLAAKELIEWGGLTKTEQGRELARAAGVIVKELHSANIGRLDAFLSQSREAKRRKARGEKPPYTPDELLSLAVSGFLLGSPSAATKPEIALNLWKTRVFALAYLRESAVAGRTKILDDYKKDVTPQVDIEEIAQMITHLPPVEPAVGFDDKPVTERCGPRKRTAYELKLPPEYTHNRAYPVVIAMHEAGERNTEMIKRLGPICADQGYILVAPEWGRIAATWEYSPEEHDKILDVLRDLKRRFQIDSDRIYLTGLGEGGKAAFDVGLSHPDLFAGVMPIGTGPHFYPRRYWRNAQFLPFYVVTGTRMLGENSIAMREVFTNWVNRGFGSIWVEYKGRGTEWFAGELPLMFDWMRNQKRAFPLHRLGTDGAGGVFGEEFTTFRADDNRFYWVSTTGISKRCQMPVNKWNNFVVPATITASVSKESNAIYIKTVGMSQVSLWIGRNAQGRYLLDLDRPVTVRVGLTTVWNAKPMPASLGVLMEDLYRRGDRQHLFVARLDINIRP